MKKRNSYLGNLLVIFALFALSACGGSGGGGSGGGFEVPVANLSGTAKLTWSDISNDCGDLNGIIFERIMTVVQNGNNIAVADDQGNVVLKGTISGNQIVVAGSFPNDGGITTVINLPMTVSEDTKSSSGTASWRWTDGFDPCQGESSVTVNFILSNDSGGSVVKTLTVTTVGSGTVKSSPTGVDCGSDCTESYPEGAVVTLTAVPATGSVFSAWSGDADCSDGSVTMSVDLKCAATFTATGTTPTTLGIWSEKEAMPTPRGGFGSASVNGKIYVIGGSDLNSRLAVVEEYDPSTNTWTNCGIPAPGNGCRSMLSARSSFGISVVGGKIYVMGGRSAPTTFLRSSEVYNPVNNSWSSITDMPAQGSEMVAIAIGTNIHVIGGGIFGSGSSVRVYNTLTDTWTAKSPIPPEHVTDNFSANQVNGMIYLTGGFDSSSSGAVNRVVEYNPVTEVWSPKAPMSASRTSHTSAVISGKLYVFGGEEIFCSGLTSVEVYDTITDKWSSDTDIPFAIPRCSHLSASVSEDKAYVTWGTIFGGAILYDFTP